ncbi:hypothetical protein KKH27_14225 [bacterium]|nr:hypothetical protein [bacterium]MBU1984317.1 hypothetical protein [bacterium]
MLIFLVLGLTAEAGVLRIKGGEVSGFWPNGTVVVVEGPIWVPEGSGLVIDSGVVITFEVTAPFTIYGSFEATGTERQPIRLNTPRGWAGFRFEENGYDVRRLTYVLMDEESPLADSVIVMSDARVNLFKCNFRAEKSCLYAYGGRLRADSCRFFSTGLLCNTVYVNGLNDNLANGCSSSEGNRFCNNMVVADVPTRSGPFPPYRYTIGLKVNRVNNICLRGNVVEVIGPGDVVGVYFDERGGPGLLDLWEMWDCVVTSRSYNQQPCGVFNANEGQLHIFQCTIDVARAAPDNWYYSTGVAASQSARVLVNSSAVQVDAGDIYFQSRSRGYVQVEYAVYWRTSGSRRAPEGLAPGNRDGFLNTGGENNNNYDSIVFRGPSYFTNPGFLLQGEWGDWRKLEDVELYYGLHETSPCINAADSSRCPYDPDGTLPDIGRFFYYHSPSAAPNPVADPLSREFVLSPPYPNPFNAMTVIPFEVPRSGYIRVLAFNVLGEEIAVLASSRFAPGNHLIRWNGGSVPSGIYFVIAELDGIRTAARSVILLK